jgi:flagellar protein FlbD
MIPLTRLNGSEIHLNADLVATVESHHDTVITLVDGKTFVVMQTAEEVVRSIIAYRASILAMANRHLDDVPYGDQDAAVIMLRPVETGE